MYAWISGVCEISIYLSIYPSIHLTIYLSIYLFIYLPHILLFFSPALNIEFWDEVLDDGVEGVRIIRICPPLLKELQDLHALAVVWLQRIGEFVGRKGPSPRTHGAGDNDVVALQLSIYRLLLLAVYYSAHLALVVALQMPLQGSLTVFGDVAVKADESRALPAECCVSRHHVSVEVRLAVTDVVAELAIIDLEAPRSLLFHV